MKKARPTSRRVRYQVAASLDGFIAGPNGEIDWIPPEPAFDFGALFAQFDTWLMGRRTWEALKGVPDEFMPTGHILVVSTTLRQEDHPDIEVVSSALVERLSAVRAEPGKDIWLYGGGTLFRSLLALGQVDSVEIALLPILLGEGVPLLQPPSDHQALELKSHTAYPSGMLMLEYAIRNVARSAD